MMTRRGWLGGAALMTLAGGRVAPGAPPPDVWGRIRERGRLGRLPLFEGVDSAHFRSLGDAPLGYQTDALALAESFAADYLAHFRAKGFALDWPTSKLPVVILAGETSYAAFEQGEIGEAEGGAFDLDANWLVTFDFRPRPGAPRGLGANDPRLDNTLTLVHELFHQLAYNTGLLTLRADVPRALDEGLATYAETWRPRRQGQIGATNRRRVLGLAEGRKRGVAWIPVATLLADDKTFDDEKTAQTAYGVASALAHRLLKDQGRVAQLRSYLLAARTTTDPARRVPLLVEHFGDLDRLDAEIRGR